MSYHHFTVDERESILIYRMQGLNFSQIAKLLHRHPASISREWKRHLREESYSPREKCKLTKFLLKHYPPSK
ncbi:helix-turn-helix domain-containing protein [Streptococcus sp. Marseille-Q5986]|uniref:helix-turn-helix domain-containing protein n=1 Tax=Streptococcus sp. Marseille-Q5986 TaxID=2972782 RepID=UPI003A5C1A3B